MPKKIIVNVPKLKKKKSTKKQETSKPLAEPAGSVAVRKQPKQSPGNMRGLPPLTECAAKYFTAIASPWDPSGYGACVPTGNNRDSHKVTAFSRFTVTIGTSGFGFAAMSPCLANDMPCVTFSTATYTQTTTNILTTTAGVASFVAGVGNAKHNGPYTTLQLTPTEPAVGAVQDLPNGGRIVSAGMSAQYTGTVMNMGGLMYCLTHPNHSSLVFTDTAAAGAFQETDVARIGEQKCWIGDYGHTNVEQNFTSLASLQPAMVLNGVYTFTEFLYPYCNATPMVECTSGPIAAPGVNVGVGAGLGSPTSVILFTGNPGNTFEVECVFHIEYIGRSAQAAATPSHHDEKGFSLVQAAAGRAPQVKAAKYKDWTTSCIDALKEVTNEVGPAAIAAGKKILMGLIL